MRHLTPWTASAIAYPESYDVFSPRVVAKYSQKTVRKASTYRFANNSAILMPRLKELLLV
ncbi:hypothetical protein PAMC26510_07950 [Caballeronia sordidicola]|uniref:Uncharacterized protein n=1 Tax=Caballeronia sordidicola TaxID=196367 RepID=A0A242N2A7_CABSO|nr:hypothetical protein PAMC26510_07950 [Caballeronia sordidicola]